MMVFDELVVTGTCPGLARLSAHIGVDPSEVLSRKTQFFRGGVHLFVACFTIIYHYI